MKKILAVAAIAMFVVTGCGKDEPDPTDPTTSVSNQCFNGAPDWVISGGIEGEITSVGSSPISKAGLDYSRKMAMASARDEMARSISIKVNNMVKNFTQSTGIGDDEVVDRVSADVSKQIASETLQGTRQRAMWTSPCNELYVMMGIDNTYVKDELKNNVTSSYQNDNALWQQFQSQKAQDELDAAIQAEFK